MSELRAPDPTLDALPATSMVVTTEHLLPVAHTEYHDSTAIVTQYAGHARWFAVPCRKCFPDAPPPGHEPVGPGWTGSGTTRGNRYLAWQVSS